MQLSNSPAVSTGRPVVRQQALNDIHPDLDAWLDDASADGSGSVIAVDGLFDYQAASDLQEMLVDRLCTRVGHPPVLLLLEHPLVVTLGRNAADKEATGATTPVIRTRRGGSVTVHGPGQLIGYPIVSLAQQGLTVTGFVRQLEQGLQSVCERLSVPSWIREGFTGLWTDDGKIGSIGIAVRRSVTWHGYALNVHDQTANFGAVSPCALPGVRPDSIDNHQPRVALDAVRNLAAADFVDRFCNGLARATTIPASELC